MMALLCTCLNALAVLLEIQLPSEISESIKLIEESLTYLATLINFAPTESINCVRQLLKFMFKMNFVSRADQYAYLIENRFLTTAEGEGENEVFARVRELHRFQSGGGDIFSSRRPSEAGSMSSSPLSTPLKLVGIASSGLSTAADAKRMENGGNIKLFEPVVIQCLKVSLMNNDRGTFVIHMYQWSTMTVTAATRRRNAKFIHSNFFCFEMNISFWEYTRMLHISLFGWMSATDCSALYAQNPWRAKSFDFNFLRSDGETYSEGKVEYFATTARV